MLKFLFEHIFFGRSKTQNTKINTNFFCSYIFCSMVRERETKEATVLIIIMVQELSSQEKGHSAKESISSIFPSCTTWDLSRTIL